MFMNKNTICRSIAALALVTVVLSGCSLFSSAEDKVPVATTQEKSLTKRTGVIMRGGDTGITQADATTYVLLADNGEQISLLSLEVQLGRYYKRKVELEGRYSAEMSSMEVSGLKSLVQDTNEKSQYTQGTLGVRFSYPSVWHLEALPNENAATQIVITPYELNLAESEKIDTITIQRSLNTDRLSPREWLKLDEQYRLPQTASIIAHYQPSTLGVSQLNAVKQADPDGKITFYVQRDTYMYLLSYESINDADKDSYRNAFLDLVNSFEFIPFSTVTKETPLASPTTTQPTTQTPLPVAPIAPPAVPLIETQQPLPTDEKTKKFDAYIKGHLGDVTYEASTDGEWQLVRYELAYEEGSPFDDFTHVYIVYKNNTEQRRVLVAVTNTNPVTVEKKAYFKPGTVTDWTLSEGTDVAKGKEKHIVNVAGGVALTVKKGMQLIDARAYKVTFQIPAGWYWQYSDGNYEFATKSFPTTPVAKLSNVLMISTQPSQNISDINGHAATKVIETVGEFIAICMQLDQANYCSSFSNSGDEETIKSILASIQAK